MNFLQPNTPSIHHATFKTYPSDFIVNEVMQIELTGSGEHLWLHIQKTNLNTAFVATLLAKWAGILVRDVGFSGLKDRHAVTTQWFSLHIPKRAMPTTNFNAFLQAQSLSADEKLELLQSVWHSKKLNRGTHKSNHFIITLRSVRGDKIQIEQQLNSLPKTGVPNYFGIQRFGFQGNNIAKAKAMFAKILTTNKPYKPKKHDTQQKLYFSVAKSLIFNEILSERVKNATWNTALNGELFNLDDTGAVFQSEVNAEIHARLQNLDIHPTAILYGVGSRTAYDALALENKIASLPHCQALAKGLLKTNTKASYRALRLLPKHLTWRWDTNASDDILILDFILPSGTFATSVLVALVQDLYQPNEL